jgi:hypothetical protein
MLKKLLKGCLAIAAVCAMSTSAFAQAEIHGFLWSSYGQYNSGVEGEAAYMMNSHFAPLGINVKGEKMAVYAEIDWMRTGYANHPAAGAGTAAWDNSGVGPAHILWFATDQLTVKVGHADPHEADTFARGSGIIEPLLPAYWGQDSYTHIFNYGLHAIYQLSDTMKINAGLLTEDDVGGSKIGSGMYANFGGKFGAIDVRAAYNSGTTDDWGTDADETVSNSAMMVSGQFHISDTMAVNGGYATKTLGDADAVKIMDFAFRGNKMGPGNLVVTYASETTPDVQVRNWMDLVYAYPVGPGENINFMYLSDSTTPEGGDAVTKTFVGAGFVKFF